MGNGKRDYYEVLGVAREATADEIKRAYRKLAVQFHPDRNQEDPAAAEKFKEATEAYKALSDPEQRRIYDAYGHRGLEGSGFTGIHDMEDIFSSFDIFGSVLGDLFGFGGRGGRRGPRPGRGSNLRTRVNLTFEESFAGVEKNVAVSWLDDCPACQGSGAAPDGLEVCSDCRGTGQQVTRAGFFTMSAPCGRCGGSGHSVTKRCKECDGGGKTRIKRELKVKIPAGVDTGDSMAMAGQGAAGRHGGPPGDLVLVFEVAPHERFVREGSDIHVHQPVSFLQASLGDKVTLDGPEGKVTVTVEAGTQPGAVHVVKSKGMPDPNSGRRGNLVIHLDVQIPERLSREQRKALEALLPLFEVS